MCHVSGVMYQGQLALDTLTRDTMHVKDGGNRLCKALYHNPNGRSNRR